MVSELILNGILVGVSLGLFILFFPLIDYHYYGKGKITFTHISLYNLLRNRHEVEGKGFFGGEIRSQLEYMDRMNRRDRGTTK